MRYLYGHVSDVQFAEYKKKLHKNLFWLLLYKDPKTRRRYENMDFDQYFEYTIKKINGLNELLFYPSEIIEILVLLQTAKQECQNNPFDYSVYRKLILEAHNLVDKIT